MEFLNKFFSIKEKGSTIKTEVLAGLATFLAMAYILPVNAGMLSQTGMPFGGVFLATALAAIVATLIMGLYAKYPVALAPGMGVNAFFTYTVVFTMGASFGEALAAVLVSGVIFLIISLTGLREAIINAFPKSLKLAVGAGIGFFIAFIGLKNAGIIVDNPATFVGLGDFALPHVLLTLGGLLLGLGLYVRGNKYALIIAMTATAIVGYLLGLALGPDTIDRFGDAGFIAGLPTFGSNTSDLGSIKEIFGVAFSNLGFVLTTSGIMAVFTFLFVDFFDTAGTLVAVGGDAGLLDENGNLVDGDKALLADSIGTVAGAIFGVSTTTSFIESSVGIKQGGRTGLTSVTVAVLFALALVAYPIIGLYNQSVTAIALIMVGGMMFSQLKNLEWDNNIEVVTGFLTVIIMILSFSIAHGIAFGFFFYSVISLIAGKKISNKKGELNPYMFGLGIFFLIFYIIEYSNILG